MRRSLFAPALYAATVEPVATLFVPELDGDTFASLEELADYHHAQAEYDAEMAIERALETNDRYAWEEEQDRLRAAAFGFAY